MAHLLPVASEACEDGAKASPAFCVSPFGAGNVLWQSAAIVAQKLCATRLTFKFGMLSQMLRKRPKLFGAILGQLSISKPSAVELPSCCCAVDAAVAGDAADAAAAAALLLLLLAQLLLMMMLVMMMRRKIKNRIGQSKKLKVKARRQRRLHSDSDCDSGGNFLGFGSAFVGFGFAQRRPLPVVR